MQRIWHEVYGTKTAREIDLTGHRSVVALVEAAMKRHAGRDAFVSLENRLSTS